MNKMYLNLILSIWTGLLTLYRMDEISKELDKGKYPDISKNIPSDPVIQTVEEGEEGGEETKNKGNTQPNSMFSSEEYAMVQRNYKTLHYMVNTIKDAGNKLYKENKYGEALEKYTEAYLTILEDKIRGFHQYDKQWYEELRGLKCYCKMNASYMNILLKNYKMALNDANDVKYYYYYISRPLICLIIIIQKHIIGEDRPINI